VFESSVKRCEAVVKEGRTSLGKGMRRATARKLDGVALCLRQEGSGELEWDND
jgi:hypothetical protein